MVERRNILLVPADAPMGAEVIAALRHEKSLRLILLPERETLPAIPGATCLPPASPECTLASLIAEHEVAAVLVLEEPWETRARAIVSDRDMPVIALSHLPSGAVDMDEVFTCYTSRTGELLHCASVLADGETVRLSPASEEIRALAASHGSAHGGWTLGRTSGGEVTCHTGIVPHDWHLHRLFGVNLVLLAIFEAFGHPVSVLPPGATSLTGAPGQAGITLDTDTVFLDLDDTMLVHGALHDALEAFLARTHEAGVAVHLVTRHYREPLTTLKEHGFDPARFAEIHWLTDGTPKSKVIARYDGAVFVDDSFKERREVAETLGIPVFAPDLLGYFRFRRAGSWALSPSTAFSMSS